MIRPPVKWHGGKRYLAKRIIENFPPHRIYLEAFGGGASVLLNKPIVEVEAYNDLDIRITRLFRTLRDHRDWFIERARLTLYSEHEFDDAAEYPVDASDRDCAFLDFVRWRQSFGGQGKSFSMTTARARGGMAGDVNAWWTAIEGLAEVVERIRRVEILNRSALDAIPQFDADDCLVYADPPYLEKTRVSKKVYAQEMASEEMTNEEHHRALAKTLLACKSKVVLSGYPSDLYQELYGDWRRVDFDIANHAAGGGTKRRMTECIWMNYPAIGKVVAA